MWQNIKRVNSFLDSLFGSSVTPRTTVPLYIFLLNQIRVRPLHSEYVRKNWFWTKLTLLRSHVALIKYTRCTDLYDQRRWFAMALSFWLKGSHFWSIHFVRTMHMQTWDYCVSRDFCGYVRIWLQTWIPRIWLHVSKHLICVVFVLFSHRVCPILVVFMRQ